MKKKWLVLLLTVASCLLFALGIAGCDPKPEGGQGTTGGTTQNPSGGEDNSVFNGTYYSFFGDTVYKETYLILQDGNWKDSSNVIGIYTVNGTEIIFYDVIGTYKREKYRGTLQDGILSLNIMGVPVGTYKKLDTDFSEGEDIPHFHSMTYFEGIEAGCEAVGNVEYWFCSICKKSFADEQGITQLPFVAIAPTGHTYDTVLSSGGQYHYYAATCGHNVQKNRDEHIFNEDLVCMVCAYQVPPYGGGSSGGSSNAYSVNRIFSAGSEGDVRSYKTSDAEADKAYVGLNMLREGMVYFRRDLAYRWYEHGSKTEYTDRANPSEEKYFSITFSFLKNHFEKFSIVFESDARNASQSKKAVNKISFSFPVSGELVIEVTPSLGESSKIIKTKDAWVSDWSKVDFTLSFAQSSLAGAFALSLTYTDGVNASQNCFDDVGGGQSSIVFNNFANDYAEYRSNASSVPNTPITFQVENSDNWEGIWDESKYDYDSEAIVLIKELNGQSLEVVDYTASVEYSNDIIAVSGGGVKDTEVPVLVLEHAVYPFTLGQRFSLAYKAIDVLDDSVTVTRRYYMATKDESGSYLDLPEIYEYNILTTSTVFDPSKETDTIAYLSIYFKLDDGRNTNYVWLSWYAKDYAVETINGWDYIIAKSAGEAVGDSENFEFIKTENGYSIAHYSGMAKSVVIPSSYMGEPVVEIEPFAFYKNDRIESVTIPYGVINIRSYAFAKCTALASIAIPDSVIEIGGYAFGGCSNLTSVTLPRGVTFIADSTFSGCVGLTSITIPNSVTLIGDSAFYGCVGLTSITIPNSVTTIGDSAFYGCSGLTSITIPNSVTLIGDSAFSGCVGLTNVTIPDSVTSIGAFAFGYCSGLMSVVIGSDVQEIAYGAFSRCDCLVEVYNKSNLNIVVGSYENGGVALYAKNVYKAMTESKLTTDMNGFVLYDGTILVAYVGTATNIVIPQGVIVVERSAFLDCEQLMSIIIPDSVTTIESYAFQGCRALKSVVIPNSVTMIGDSAFSGCKQLVSATIGNGVTSIGEYAFYGCEKLVSVMIPDGVTLIGKSAFSGCEKLVSVVIPDGVTLIGKSAFSGCEQLVSVTIPNSVTMIGDSAFSGCEQLVSVAIGNGVTFIGDSAFYGCSGLTNIVISDSVTEIGEGVFNGCRGLTNATIGRGVTFISRGLFQGCVQLKEVIIPHGVTAIAARAFYGCSGLTSVTISDSVVTIGNNAFDGCVGLTNIVYKGTVARWEAVLVLSYYWKENTGDFIVHCTDGDLTKDEA